jgi:AcrR family transcriptional regulator
MDGIEIGENSQVSVEAHDTGRASGADTRTRILAVALELFATQGYAGTSIRDIAEPMGMTKAALYYHFASKEEILDGVTAPIRDDMNELTRWAGSTPAPGAKELLTAMVDVLSRHAPLIQTIFNDPSVDHRGHLEDAKEELRTLMEILAGSDDPAARLRARCALGAVQFGVIGTVHNDPRFSGPPKGDDALRLVIGGGHTLDDDVRAEVVAAALRTLGH